MWEIKNAFDPSPYGKTTPQTWPEHVSLISLEHGQGQGTSSTSLPLHSPWDYGGPKSSASGIGSQTANSWHGTKVWKHHIYEEHYGNKCENDQMNRPQIGIMMGTCLKKTN